MTSKNTTSEGILYLKTTIFGLVIYSLFYAYTNWLSIPGAVNKSVADVSIFLMGLSMLLSGVCYFWNIFDPLIRYRKYLGLIGFAFGLVHIALSFSALQAVLKVETWQKGLMWPAFTGLLAAVIFTVMALVSNNRMAIFLGGKLWRYVLRTGYLAVILVAAHVVLLKSARWLTWYNEGMKTLPSLSLLISIFMVVVVLMRVALWVALKRKKSLSILT
jgi:DMSO/TMAO reductase YedYZ heme-binding membrane subunit